MIFPFTKNLTLNLHSKYVHHVWHAHHYEVCIISDISFNGFLTWIMYTNIWLKKSVENGILNKGNQVLDIAAVHLKFHQKSKFAYKINWKCGKSARYSYCYQKLKFFIVIAKIELSIDSILLHLIMELVHRLTSILK